MFVTAIVIDHCPGYLRGGAGAESLLLCPLGAQRLLARDVVL